MPILLQLCREKLGWEPNKINILSSLVGPGALNEANYNYSLEQCKALQHLSSFRKIDPQFLEISRPMSLIMELVACVSNLPFYSCSSLDCLLLFGVCQFLKTVFVVWAFYKHFFSRCQLWQTSTSLILWCKISKAFYSYIFFSSF